MALVILYYLSNDLMCLVGKRIAQGNLLSTSHIAISIYVLNLWEVRFISNYARALEVLHCFDKCIEILEKTKFKKEKKYGIEPKPSKGYGATEAPRGTLYHHYEIDRPGAVKFANILTPTAQNLLNIEEDLYALVPTIIDKPKKDIKLNLEMAVRNYDPCISCSTHFLEIEFK